MKKGIIILSILAAITSSCKWGESKKTAGNEGEQNDSIFIEIPTETDTLFTTSVIRPNEKLQVKKIYTDSLEYIDYNDDGDYSFFVVRKNNKNFRLLDGRTDRETYPGLNRGDKIEIQWKIDSVLVGADSENWEMIEWVISINGIEDGKLSTFRKINKKSIVYTFIDDFSDIGKRDFKKEIEYFLANTTDENILQCLSNENGEILVYISSYRSEYEEYTRGVPSIMARIENHNQDELFRLGIEFEYDGENFYGRTFYQIDKDTNELTKIEMQ